RVVLIVAVAPPSLNSTTDTSPLANCLASTSWPPDELTWRPWRPSESWSTAITALLPRIDSVVALAVTRLLPASSGAAISAQRLNSVRSSVVDMPRPTSSMSGSFHAPGFAYVDRPTFWWKIDSMLPYDALMSVVVRHRLPTLPAHVHGELTPHSQMLYTMDRPLAASASRIAEYRLMYCACVLLPALLQLSYFR